MNAINIYAVTAGLVQITFGLTMGAITLEGLKEVSHDTYLIGSSVFAILHLLIAQIGIHDKLFDKIKPYAVLIVTLEFFSLCITNAITYFSTDLVTRWLIVGCTGSIFQAFTTIIWEQIKQNTGKGRTVHSTVELSTGAGFIVGMLIAFGLSKFLEIKVSIGLGLIIQVSALWIETIATIYVIKKHM